MRFYRSITLFSPLFGFLLFLTSCSKEGSAPQGSSNAVFDSSQTAKVVTVTEKEHRIYIRPKQGTSYYYRIYQHSVSTSSGSAPGQQDISRSATSDNIIYVHQIIRGIRSDSSIDMTFKFDSMSVNATQDTMKVDLSSSRAADRTDPRFASFAALLGEDIGVIITKFGDVKEVYGTTNIIEKIMKPYPDSVKLKQGEYIKNQINARIGQYVLETLMHYPDQPLAKDSTQRKDYEDNIPITAAVTFPMQISIKQTLTGFEERGDKVLAVFTTNSNARPVRSVIEEGPVKATLGNFLMSTKEDIRVEDPTGMLIFRNVIEEKNYSLNLESSQAAGKTIHTEEKAKSTTKVELLK